MGTKGFDYEIMLDDCWDGERSGNWFRIKVPFNPLLTARGELGTPPTIGFIDFVEDGNNVYRCSGTLHGVDHHCDDKLYTELEGQILAG